MYNKNQLHLFCFKQNSPNYGISIILERCLSEFGLMEKRRLRGDLTVAFQHLRELIRRRGSNFYMVS